MIHEENGRFRSELTAAELQDMIEQETKGLTVDERLVVELLFGEMLAKTEVAPTYSLLKKFSEAEYRIPPVDVRQFITDDHYLGKTCGAMYPKLIDAVEELFAGGYRVGLFTGSIGSGKTFSASVVVAYIIYQISCLRDPHRTFGIAPNSDISIIALSVTTALAREVAFENIVTKIASSPYFQENFPCKALKQEMRFPKNVTIRPLASSNHSMLGKNVIAVFLDEGNFLNQNRAGSKKFDQAHGMEKDRAEVIYNLLLNRMSSRFMKQGKTPGMFVIASSKQTESDFTTRLIKESRNDASMFVRDYAKWDLSPQDFKPERFHVLVGPGSAGTRIVEDHEVEEVKQTMPEGSVLFKVPIELRPSFERDLDGAVRDLAGISTQSITPYFRRQDKILAAFKPGRIHPFTTLTLDQSKPGKFIWEQLVDEVKQSRGPIRYPAQQEAKIFVPKYFPRSSRHIHIDLSLRNDATGFVMGCIAGWKDVIRQAQDGIKYAEKAPIYFIDLILQIDPSIGGEIDIGEVRNLVYELSGHGFSITEVSFDRFQPYESMQALTQRGYSTELIPLSKSTVVYDGLKEAFYEDRIILYPYAPLQDELAKLQMDVQKRKVDHPPGGKSDVSDALAGCVYTLQKQKLATTSLPIFRTGTANQDPWVEQQQLRKGLPSTTAVSPHDIVADLARKGILVPFIG